MSTLHIAVIADMISLYINLKRDTNVTVPYRPELEAGSILKIAEGPGVEYQVDVGFEKDGNIFRVM